MSSGSRANGNVASQDKRRRDLPLLKLRPESRPETKYWYFRQRRSSVTPQGEIRKSFDRSLLRHESPRKSRLVWDLAWRMLSTVST